MTLDDGAMSISQTDPLHQLMEIILQKGQEQLVLTAVSSLPGLVNGMTFDFKPGGCSEFVETDDTRLFAGLNVKLYHVLVSSKVVGQVGNKGYTDIQIESLQTLSRSQPGSSEYIIICLLYTSPSPRDS